MAWFVEPFDGVDAQLPVRIRDLEVVGRIAEDIDAADIARVLCVVCGTVGADSVVRMHVKIGIECARGGQRGIDCEPGNGCADLRLRKASSRANRLESFSPTRPTLNGSS